MVAQLTLIEKERKDALQHRDEIAKELGSADKARYIILEISPNFLSLGSLRQ